MRIVFMGSAELACPSLEALLASPLDDVVGIVTQPDRPKGRSQKLSACPIHQFAATKGVPIFMPEKASDPAFIETLEELLPDLIVLVAYGQFLKRPILELPLQGAINVHPSLLPRYRGAAPIQWALARGETTTGVSIMYMSEKMDAGDIILQEPYPIQPEDTAGTLEPRLAQKGAKMLLRAIDLIREGRAPRTPQDESLVTLAPKLKKEDGRIDWTKPAQEIANRVRAFNPWPCCYCEPTPGSGEYLKVLKARVEILSGKPGEVQMTEKQDPIVAAGDGSIRLLEVQPPGKRPMTGADWARGRRLVGGEVLG
ncbi:MAG TPA: methionyl-tRNA formyltransferase [Verrucomicrobia bacterium]|nr:MAG: methionyl-tRNA formyltransferase [Lentisphaerae bacterium GWF2_57_35]HBA86194.1 methionyl-tRNA formyltransferase [Verrucomicrobiota bacterium]